MNKKTEKVFKKSVMAGCLTTIPNAHIKAEIICLFDEMLRDNNISDSVTYKHCAYSIFPAVAVYKVLTQHEGNIAAFAQVEKCVLENAKKQEVFFKSLSKVPFFFKLFGNMCKVGVKTNFGAPAFEMTWEENSNKYIKWTCRSCVYSNELTRFETAELTKIFCKADDVMYGNLSGAKWARTKTIGNGDELCDFKFISNVVGNG